MPLRSAGGPLALTLFLFMPVAGHAQTDTSAPASAPGTSTAAPSSTPAAPAAAATPTAAPSSGTGTATSASMPVAPPEHRSRFRIGPQVGVYLPTEEKTRSRFGDAWLILGIGIGNVSDMHQSGRFSLDITALSTSRSGEYALLVPIGLSYSVALSRAPGGKSVAYAGASLDGVIADLRSDRDHLPSRVSATGGAGLFVGTRFSETGYVEARYNAIAPTRGFDLSGLSLMTGLRF